MKIENIRLGLATNSSSSHSLIFNLDSPSRDWEDAKFGWNEFCCNCEPSKRMYLAAVLLHSLEKQVGLDIGRIVVKAWLGVDIPEDEDDGGYFYGIDHQSLMMLPVNQKREVDKEFFDALVAEYMDPKLAIVGGNDNEPYRIFTEGRKPHLIETGDYAGNNVCRKDPNTGHWVLFNRQNGTKIRLHFDNDAPAYTKAFAPELIDIKITDYCDLKCSYCYQDSTDDGKHAEEDFLRGLVSACNNMGVFEVALGGGEPTLHPRFPEILRDFRSDGVIPNFTTRSYKWLHDEKTREAVRKYAGKFAISVTQPREMERAHHFADELELASPKRDYETRDWSCRMGFQYVMGTTDLKAFRKLLEALPYGMELTLLGYKDVGRGADWKPYDYTEWLDAVRCAKGKHCGSIGIDTSLATQFRDEVLELVDERLVTFEEGKFSMYVDAVKQVAAPSSYCDESKHIDVSGKYGKDWLKLFARF